MLELLFVSVLSSVALICITAKVARHDGLGPVGAWVSGTVPVLMIIGLALSASALARLAVGG